MSLYQDICDACKGNGISGEYAALISALVLELVEVEKLWDVSWECCSELKILYCKARKERNGPFFFYIPIPSTTPFSIATIEEWQNALETNSITLVIRSSDSTALHYDFTKGLVQPQLTFGKSKESDRSFKKPKVLLTEALRNLDSKKS